MRLVDSGLSGESGGLNINLIEEEYGLLESGGTMVECMVIGDVGDVYAHMRQGFAGTRG